MKKLSYIILLLFVLLVGVYFSNDETLAPLDREPFSVTVKQDNPRLLAAYRNGTSRFRVEGQGIIVKVLKDDLEGARHQRLLLRVNKKQTLLIAHNIDLAPRIPHPKVGTPLKFYGEYIWNNKGGLIHWTHKDSRRNHQGGWLIYQGKRYE